MKQMDPSDILDIAHKATINGKPAIEDPDIRKELVELLSEARGLQLSSSRAGIQPLVQDNPLSLPLSLKLLNTEYIRRLNQFAIKLQGPKGAYYVDEPNGFDKGIWQRGYLNAFSANIGGGTSQIQRNIIGENVLGLPKTR